MKRVVLDCFPLHTERLLIRPMQLADTGELFSVYRDADLMRHLTADVPACVEEAEQWVREKIELFEAHDGLSLWTVIHRESGAIVGDAGLQWEDYGSGPTVGLGGRGARAFWHQGLALEASRACLAVGFDNLGLAEVGAETAPDNFSAQRLLERLGMSPGGTNPEGWPVYLITRDKWSAQ